MKILLQRSLDSAHSHGPNPSGGEEFLMPVDPTGPGKGALPQTRSPGKPWRNARFKGEYACPGIHVSKWGEKNRTRVRALWFGLIPPPPGALTTQIQGIRMNLRFFSYDYPATSSGGNN